MLVELRASNLAVLETVTLRPGAGLTAITGETGSGKSLCVTALRLATGARADGDPVRHGCDGARVAAVFDGVPEAVRARLDAIGIPDDDLLTLSRELSRGGRGACRINGALVSLTTLRGIGELLVEVTAQGEGHRLVRQGRQRGFLDAAGGPDLAAARRATASAVAAWREADAAVRAAAAAAAADAGALEAAAAVAGELGAIGLRSGEDVELAAERLRLRQVGALAAAVEGVRSACAGGDDAAGSADLLAAAAAGARSVAGLDTGVDALLAGCAEEAERLRDLGFRALGLLAGLEPDPGRLLAVEERLDVLDRVRRRYGGSIEAAIDALERADELLEGAAGRERGPDAARARAAACREAVAESAARLSRLRRAAAVRLEAAVTAQLRRLRLPAARFRVVLSRTGDPAGIDIDGERLACSTDGVDDVEFRLATSADGVPIPLGEGTSGGELSRVALALRSVAGLDDPEDVATLVLDEVDAGLGGETAARVGDLLALIGLRRQVLVVTHRAEIAARASDHLVVHRHESGGLATATIGAVEGASRAAELARLMSGGITEAALARAGELLDEGGRVAQEARPALARRARAGGAGRRG